MFVQAWKQVSLTFGRRAMSTGVPIGDAVASSSPGTGALLAAVGTTFGTYMVADFLSNFIQHPTQLVSYSFVADASLFHLFARAIVNEGSSICSILTE